jgi:Tfp pilus assembly protein PilX
MSASMRTRDPHGENGAVLAIAIVLLAVMLTVSLASFSLVGAGQQRSRAQRERETSLNLAEAVLYDQGFSLAQAWPGHALRGATMPAGCSSAVVQALCPDPNTLAAANSTAPASANFTNADAAASVSWTTRVRDNGAPISDAFDMSIADAAQSGTNARTGVAYACPGPCKWDATGDLKLWVQARAVVRGRPRSIVALLRREQFAEMFARNALTAGSFETTNSGNKTIIDASGSQVVVRCTSTAPACTDYKSSKDQVLPRGIVHDAAYPPAMTATQLSRFKAAAISADPPTYYTSCPPTYTGAVVYVDVPQSTVCTDSSVTYNSAIDPGIVIMPRGRLDNINGTYNGLLYLGNEQQSSAPVLSFGDNAEVFGGVAIDGPGRLVLGQSSGPRPTITFRNNVFDALSTYGTTGLVQNTWRELPPV